MNLKAETMSAYGSGGTGEAWHLLRKIFLLLLVVTATALGLVLLSRQRNNVPPVLFNVLANCSLGLLAGLATRLVLKGRHGLIQALTSTAISLVGLGILGYFTDWRSGIGPFQAGLVPVHIPSAAAMTLPVEFGRSAMNMLDLVNALVAVDTSWLALRVWKQGPRANHSPLPLPRPRRQAPPAPIVDDPVEPVPMSRAIVPAVVPVQKRPAPSTSGSGSRSRIRRKKAERAVIARPTSASRPVRSRRRNTSRLHRPAVRLAIHEEHKCPYCLEPVKRNDPRGVVECQICHTLHHKDCWDITGNCQVPHLTTL